MGSDVAPAVTDTIVLSLVTSMTGVSMITVPGSPAAVGGIYLVIGSVMKPVPEYGLITVELGL
jgi:hypothetical protein